MCCVSSFHEAPYMHRLHLFISDLYSVSPAHYFISRPLQWCLILLLEAYIFQAGSKGYSPPVFPYTYSHSQIHNPHIESFWHFSEDS